MKWDELELHFRGETQQDAPPFGEGVVEWDYSRYTRALGLGRTPGLDTLKRRGCVVAAGRPDFWDDAAHRLEQWSKQRDWRLIRVSARPSTVVPDPVIYHLGIEVTHPDSLIFCGAGQQGSPALGKRPRSPAMRIPLSPAERWLIAADRVRRRVRAESATKGLVIFIDDAELLTPNALSILSYFLDAQCAWKSHLLSAPAQIYVVFATQAREEEWFRNTLDRFSPRAEPFLVKDKIGPRTGKRRGQRLQSTEADHILGSLCSLSYWVTWNESLDIFGQSAAQTLQSLLRDGALQCRWDRSRLMVAGAPGLPSGQGELDARLARAADRVLCTGVRARSVELARRIARVTLRSRSACGKLAGARLSNHGYAATLLAPLSTLQRICDADADSAAPAGIGDLLRSLERMVAMGRLEDARSISQSLADHPVTSRAELSRLVDTCVSIGRTVGDRVLGRDFWPSLRFGDEIASIADVVCVLSEMTLSLRLMSRREALDRWQLVEAWVRGYGERETRTGRVESPASSRDGLAARLVALLTRVWVFVASELDEHAPWPLPRTPPALDPREPLVSGLPAYLIGSIGYAGATSCVDRAGFSIWAGRFAAIRDLLTGSGNRFDLRIPTSAWIVQFTRDSRGLLATELTDEMVLLLDPTANPRLFANTARMAREFCGNREGLVTNLAMLYRGTRSRAKSLSPTPVDYVRLAAVLVDIGEPESAREVVRAAAALEPRESPTSASLFAAWIRVGLVSLDPDWLWEGSAQLAKHSAMLGSHATSILEDLSNGARDLLAGRMERAHELASNGLRRIAGSRVARAPSVKRLAVEIRVAAHRAIALLAAARLARRAAADQDPSDRDQCALLRFVRGALVDPERLEFVLPCLETLMEEAGSVNDDLVLRSAIAIHRATRGSRSWGGRRLDETLARIAPRFHVRLVRAIDSVSGIRLSNAPSAAVPSGLLAGIDRALGDSLWSVREGRASRSLVANVFRTGVLNSARGLVGRWQEDVALWRMVQAALPGCRRDQIDLTLTSAGLIGEGVPFECRHRHVISLARSNKGSRTWRLTALTRVGVQTAAPATESVQTVRGGGVEEPTDGGNTDRSSLESAEVASEWIGQSELSRELLNTVRRAARSPFPIVLVGESGTGKGLLAQLIHQWSRVARGKFIAADCASIVDELIETELFGHRRGSFTGAHRDREGLIAAADCGTLFLDELDSCSGRLQACLLRVLETGEFREVGGSGVRASSFRLVSAALPRLNGLVDTGEFRQDLYYRVSALIVRVPPLRARVEDIEPIAMSEALRLGIGIESCAVNVLRGHTWPGNVRELIHCVRRASLTARDGAIRASDLEISGSRGGRIPKGAKRASKHLALSSVRSVSELPSVLAELSHFGTGEFVDATGVSRRTAQRRLAVLVRRGILQKTGAGRATRYEVCRADQ